jgi:hypothetical protein
VFAAVALIDLLYQFWVHTEQVGKLGWFDRVFVSPSNHRVHHAVNDMYLDKNYGGILILWDRLFGTFIEEQDKEPVVYGTRSPLRSWNPVWANLEVYKAIWLVTWRAKRWRDKVWVWFAKPGWCPSDVAAKWPSVPFDINHPRYSPPLSRAEQLYCLAQFTIVDRQRTMDHWRPAGASSTLSGIGGNPSCRYGSGRDHDGHMVR